MKKIAVFIPSLSGGGAEKVMVALANGLATRGHSVDLVLLNARGPYLKDVSGDVRIVELGKHRVMASIPSLVAYLKKEKPHGIVSALNHANVATLIARRLARSAARVVISVHANITREYVTNAAMADRVLLRLMRFFYPQADAIVAVSAGLRDDLVKTVGVNSDLIQVVYNPIRIQISGTDRLEVHPWLTQDVPVIASMGRLTEQKDFETLIQAFSRLRRQRHLRLIILGEGPLRTNLEFMVRELDVKADVALPGFIDTPFAWIEKASVFVLSSAWEGFGNVLVEAMACGTPVVSTACPDGPEEILEGGKWGRLVPVGDVDGLASAIAQTIDEGRRADIIDRAAFFTVDRALDGYAGALEL